VPALITRAKQEFYRSGHRENGQIMSVLEIMLNDLIHKHGF
jgi:hypothetical protein